MCPQFVSWPTDYLAPTKCPQTQVPYPALEIKVTLSGLDSKYLLTACCVHSLSSAGKVKQQLQDLGPEWENCGPTR